MSNLDESNSDEEKRVIKENRKKDNIYKDLGNTKRKVQVEIKERNFEPKWK